MDEKNFACYECVLGEEKFDESCVKKWLNWARAIASRHDPFENDYFAFTS